MKIRITVFQRSLKALVLSSLLTGALSAQSAQQCLTNGPGIYGAVTVSGCANDPPNGVTNPMSGAGFGISYDGIGLTQSPPGQATCDLQFSHPIRTSSITLKLEVQQAQDALSIATNAVPYMPVPADIFNSPLAGGLSPNPLIISGTAIGGIGSNTDIPPSIGSSGEVRLTNNVPEAITSLTLTENYEDYGALIGVCFDDAAVAPAGNVAAVPTLSEWALSGLLLLCGVLGARRLVGRRNRVV